MGNGLGGEFAGYSLVWSDEFDGAAGSPPDRRFWAPETGGHGWGNQELQYYTDSTGNAALDGAGHLAIVVRQADPPGGRPTARIRAAAHTPPRGWSARTGCHSATAWSEARIKIPVARGIWPAFWMLGQDFDRTGWPGCGEIDVHGVFRDRPACGPGSRARARVFRRPGYRRLAPDGLIPGQGFLRLFAQLGTRPDPLVRQRQASITPSRLRICAGNRGSSIMTSSCSSTPPSAASHLSRRTARPGFRRPC